MLLLTKQQQEVIERQIGNKGRDIDVSVVGALGQYLPKDYLLDSLMLYQTSDGGFGNGLYIDCYNPGSSVYQIYEAYRLLDMLDYDSSCDLELYPLIMNKSGNYLYNRATIKDNRWYGNAMENNKYAHAFLFEYCEQTKKLLGYHPTAAIVGYTLVLQKTTKAYYKKALKMADIIINDFLKMDELTKYEFISFNSFLNSLKKANVYADRINDIEAHLTLLAKKQVSLDFSDSEAILPIDVALYLNDVELNEKINLQLDYIIGQIKPHGLWENEADWGVDKIYPEEDSAKLKWVGAMTVNNYYLLKKYGRME